MGLLADAKASRRTHPYNRQSVQIKAHDGVLIRAIWAAAGDADTAKGTVLFVPGRTEFAEKFYEDMAIWRGFGFWSAAMDLRGQGLSHRECPDRDKHFVTNFDRHMDDIDKVWDHLESVGAPKPWFMMAHSAGSHCTLRYLHDHGDRIDRAFLSAPMAGFYEDGVPPWLIKLLATIVPALGGGRAYVPGHGGYEPGLKGWRKLLTHDMDRFEDEDHWILNENKDLAVGGVTYGWIKAALASNATLTAPGYAEAITPPVLLMSAGAESIVSNAAQQDVASRMPACRFETIDGAMHELLKETDDIRKQVWHLIAEEAGLDATLL